MTNNNDNGHARFISDHDQAERAIQQLAEWAHLDLKHGQDHSADAQKLIEGMTKDQLGKALIVAGWTFARIVPAKCEGDSEPS